MGLLCKAYLNALLFAQANTQIPMQTKISRLLELCALEEYKNLPIELIVCKAELTQFYGKIYGVSTQKQDTHIFSLI